MEHELRQAGYDPRIEVVETEEDFLGHLTPELDVILADYTLSRFDALRALTHLRENELDVPCIIVSSTLSDEWAVETIRQGAADYLLKDRLARLGPAVRRAMRERHLLRERRRTDRALQRSESLNRAVLRSLVTHIAVLDAEGNIIMANEAWKAFAAGVD
jgi:DNA-binding NtrC family response regulator